jgi:putative selenate reductase
MEDGVIFRELLQPISHKEGKLLCSVMTLGERDASGRRSPIPTEKTVMITADTIIEAVGENVDSDLFTNNNIFVDHKGRAVTCRKSYETNIKGVYVAGDARCGPKTVVEAIADARRVADHIAFREGLCKSNDLEKNMRDTDRLRLKKGNIIFCESPEKESERCLECGVLCENCVDVCPNRANISVHVEGASSPQIIHIDDLCNECGNCSTFCPWTGSPYKDKFTYFSREKDLNESKNSGFFDMGNGRFKVRLEGKVFTSSLDPAEKKMPKEIAALIKATRNSIPI